MSIFHARGAEWVLLVPRHSARSSEETCSSPPSKKELGLCHRRKTHMQIIRIQQNKKCAKERITSIQCFGKTSWRGMGSQVGEEVSCQRRYKETAGNEDEEEAESA